MEFDAWFARLKELAKEYPWVIGEDQESYREYFEDGDSPEFALSEQISALDFGEEDN